MNRRAQLLILKTVSPQVASQQPSHPHRSSTVSGSDGVRQLPVQLVLIGQEQVQHPISPVPHTGFDEKSQTTFVQLTPATALQRSKQVALSLTGHSSLVRHPIVPSPEEHCGPLGVGTTAGDGSCAGRGEGATAGEGGNISH